VKSAAKEIAAQKGLEFSEKWEDVNVPGKFVFIDMRLAMSDPSDLKGLPDLKKDKVVWKMNKWFPETGSGIIFFDEFNLADESVAKACYQIVNDRELNGYKLPDGYGVIMAGNEESDGVDVTELPVPLLNRMAHVKVELGVNEWLKWAMDNDVTEEIIQFIMANNDMLHLYESNMDGRDSVSPRNWVHVDDMVKNGVDIETALELWTNDKVVSKYRVWHDFISKIDIDKIVSGKKKAPEEEMEQLMLMVYLSTKVETEEDYKKYVNIKGIREEYKLMLTKMALLKHETTPLGSVIIDMWDEISGDTYDLSEVLGL